MKISTLNIFFLIVVVIGCIHETSAQEIDIWAGTYILKFPDSETIDSIKIEKTNDLNKEDVAGKYQSDLNRWELSSKSDNYEDKVIARRFLFDIEDDRNEYEEFGWTEMHSKGEMNCLDAGHFFICSTKSNSTVSIGKESFFSKTGLFGIRLHYGLFELEKYD